MQVLSVGRGFPANYYPQEELIEQFTQHLGLEHYNMRRFEELHQTLMVGGRHLALTLEQYQDIEGFGNLNDEYIRVSLDVAEQAVHEALDLAGLAAKDVDAIFFSSITGLSTPSIDARLMNRIDFRPDVKRFPFFGLGCVAGAAGMSRVNDFLQGWQDNVVLFICVELCSLTLQREDFSIANAISSGLFGDGGAALVAVGDQHPKAKQAQGPKVLNTLSHLFPNSERLLGWDIVDSGFKMVLSEKVPKTIRRNVRQSVYDLLSRHGGGLQLSDIKSWICHPGGPKVLEAFETALDLEKSATQLSWDSLREVGNLSSVSVLLILRDMMDKQKPSPGEYGILGAVGPGFHLELLLLQW